MFIVNLTYTKPLSEIENYIEAHRTFLDQQYANGIFLASGPKQPRDGGIILVAGKMSLNELETILNQDPFKRHSLARYEIVEFKPVKYDAALAGIV